MRRHLTTTYFLVAAMLLVACLWVDSGVVHATSEAMAMTDTWEPPTIIIPTAVRAQLNQHPVDTAQEISSPYGPRWKISQDRYDFHPGIDFWHADNVTIYSIGAGEIYRVYADPDSRFPGGGNTVSIKHTLVEPIIFHNQSITVLYSMYLHLSSFGSGIVEGGTVTRGQVLGQMGQTGDTIFTHLHFETRLGTQCSFPYQVANPETDCSSYQFEPKINPFFFIPKLSNASFGTSNLTSSLISITRDVSRKTITYFVPTRHVLQLNRIKFGLVDLDFSLYTGFNASDLDVLDRFNETLPWGKLWPAVFSSTSQTYNVTLEFNDAAIVTGPSSTVTYVDIWGNAVVASMPPSSSGSSSDGGTTTSAASSSNYTTTVPPPVFDVLSSGTASQGSFSGHGSLVLLLVLLIMG